MRVLSARVAVVTCPECGSVIELENESEEWDWYSEILDCPVCHKHKKRNV